MSRHATRQVEPTTPLARRIGEAQAAKGLTNEALARVLDVGVRDVQRWRKGTVTPTASNLFSLADALDRDAGWLLNGERAAA